MFSKDHYLFIRGEFYLSFKINEYNTIHLCANLTVIRILHNYVAQRRQDFNVYGMVLEACTGSFNQGKIHLIGFGEQFSAQVVGHTR